MKKIILIICTGVLVLTGCKPENKVIKTTAHKEAEQRAAKVTQPAGSCYCQQGIPAPCTTASVNVDKFMEGNSLVFKTITWSNCSAQPANGDPNCNSILSPAPTSSLKLCWYDCNTITATITNKPPCLPCYPNNFCIQLTPVVQGNVYTLQGYYDATSELLIQMTISADPNVTVKCISGTGSNATTYVCYGNY
ncbi:MAG: hypothetical protein HYX39_00395 [Bacteroidetes bacterium]|nr:hypothetical protein [Bacteroidota bacterium]